MPATYADRSISIDAVSESAGPQVTLFDVLGKMQSCTEDGIIFRWIELEVWKPKITQLFRDFFLPLLIRVRAKKIYSLLQEIGNCIPLNFIRSLVNNL